MFSEVHDEEASAKHAGSMLAWPCNAQGEVEVCLETMSGGGFSLF